jgi:hypothetical protein
MIGLRPERHRPGTGIARKFSAQIHSSPGSRVYALAVDHFPVLRERDVNAGAAVGVDQSFLVSIPSGIVRCREGGCNLCHGREDPHRSHSVSQRGISQPSTNTARGAFSYKSGILLRLRDLISGDRKQEGSSRKDNLFRKSRSTLLRGMAKHQGVRRSWLYYRASTTTDTRKLPVWARQSHLGCASLHPTR